MYRSCWPLAFLVERLQINTVCIEETVGKRSGGTVMGQRMFSGMSGAEGSGGCSQTFEVVSECQDQQQQWWWPHQRA